MQYPILKLEASIIFQTQKLGKVIDSLIPLKFLNESCLSVLPVLASFLRGSFGFSSSGPF